MRTVQFLIILGLLASCNKQQANEQLVDFYGSFDSDTLLECEKKLFSFHTPGLTKGLNDSTILDAIIRIDMNDFDYPGTTLTKENFTQMDTMSYFIEGSVLNEINLEPEQFSDSIENVTFYGELEVHFSNGDTTTLRDTIRFFVINPLEHPKLSGQIIDGKRSGEWRQYYDSDQSQILRISFFENGLRQGSDTIFHENGEVKVLSNWKDGKKNGPVELYDPPGHMWTRVNFSDGLPTSKLYYFDHTKQPVDSVDLNSL